MKTKIRLWIPATMLALSSVFLVTNCTKDDDVTKDATLPVLTTTEVIAVTQTTATSGGVMTSPLLLTWLASKWLLKPKQNPIQAIS